MTTYPHPQTNKNGRLTLKQPSHKMAYQNAPYALSIRVNRCDIICNIITYVGKHLKIINYQYLSRAQEFTLSVSKGRDRQSIKNTPGSTGALLFVPALPGVYAFTSLREKLSFPRKPIHHFSKLSIINFSPVNFSTAFTNFSILTRTTRPVLTFLE